jgi:hypothetical protein
MPSGFAGRSLANALGLDVADLDAIGKVARETGDV